MKSSETLINKTPMFFIFSFLAAVLLFIVFASFLALFPGFFQTAAQNGSPSPFLYQNMESPQDTFEGFLYLAGIIFIPVAAFFLFRWLLILEKRDRGIAASKLCWLSAAMAGIYLFLNYVWLRYYIMTYCLSLSGFAGLIFFCLAVAFRQRYDATKYRSKFIFSAGMILILVAALTQINTARSLIDNYSAMFHFSNILGVTNQIHHGRMILVNTTSLYGIAYPYLALLFTKMAGYNIVSLSLFFVFLIFLSYLFLYFALGEISGYRSWFALLMLIVLLGLSHPYYIIVHLNEEIYQVFRMDNPYYQYHPIRVIFCAFFIWFALKYVKHENRFYYGLGMFLAAFSVFWNFDSGLAVMCAWLGFLIYRDLSRTGKTFTRSLVLAVRHIGILLFSLGSLALAYSLFTYIQTHQFPVWSSLFAFHKLFVAYGFFMLPMNPFDFWHMQVWIYMAVLVFCVLKLWQRQSTERDAYFFFLAVLGLILFRYYVGRSAIFNLYPGSYPAVIILAVALQGLSTRYQPGDYTIGNFAKNSLFRHDLFKILMAIILANYGLVVWTYHAPDLLYSAGKKWEYLKNNQPPGEIEAAVTYINQTRKSDEILIFSSLAEYLHIQTSTYSPLPYSCLNEVFTEGQGQQIKGMIERKQLKQVYFILKNVAFKEQGFASLAKFIVPTIKRNYRVVKNEQLTPDLAVVIFEPVL
ncbi:MAG: hypothetical protein PHV60_04875 [bacterium]|nr:hypothetical protein [bacterium]